MEKPSWRLFLRAYAWFALIAVALVLVSLYLYGISDENPQKLDSEVSHVLQQLQTTADPEHRGLILEELMRSRNEYLHDQEIEHLAEALLLAGMMILTVEGLTRFIASKEVWENSNNLTKEIVKQADRVSENVWKAIFQRMVPAPVAIEVEKLLRSDVCRIRPQYTLVLSRFDYTDIPEGFVVSRRQLIYRLFNLTGEPLERVLPLRVYDSVPESELTKRDSTKVKLPRILEVSVNKAPVQINENQRTSLDYVVELPKMSSESEALEIYSEVESLCRLNDRALYLQTMPCCDLELFVFNDVEDLIEIQRENVYVSAGAGRLRMRTKNSWVCDGGLLPGSALSVMWKAREQNALTSVQPLASASHRDVAPIL
jgi:hypothetical protein